MDTEIESLNQLVKKSLDHYDNQKTKYYHLINNQDITFDIGENKINFIFDDKTDQMDFQILGYFDNQNYIWIWGWLLNGLNINVTKICRYLLDYGLKLEPSSNTTEHFFIKSLLVNSRIMIEEDIQLDINLAIYSYLIKDKISFIFPMKRYTDESKTNYITIYYLIK